MRGFNSVDEMSLKECVEFLNIADKKDPKRKAVEDRYLQHLYELNEQDDADFERCKTIDDCEKYIKKYTDSDTTTYYKAKHIQDAKNLCEDLFWNTHNKNASGCKRYLKKYPHGRYVAFANERTGSSKKTKWLSLGIAILVLVIVFFAGYKPVNNLSVDQNDLRFGKWGSTEEFRVTTNVSPSAIDYFNGDGHDFDIEEDGYSCKVTADPNEGDERTGEVKVVAHATLYGMRIGAGKSVSVSLSQKSGLATMLEVSISSLNLDKWGGDCQFFIRTDGVKKEKVTSLQSDWLSVSQRGNGEYFLSVSKNPGDDRQGIILIESNNLKKKIIITQSSGLANHFSLSKESIKAKISGATYRVNVITDGTTWEVSSSPSWTTIWEYSDHIMIEVENNYTNMTRSGTIEVRSNNGHYQSISIFQSCEPFAKINNVTVDHNVTRNGELGMMIHTSFDVNGMNGRSGDVRIQFYKSDNATPLHDRYNNSLVLKYSWNSNYDNCTWSDYWIFVPYSYLNMSRGFHYLSFDVSILNSSGKQLARHENVQFTWNKYY
jgi:hypothetical protein